MSSAWIQSNQYPWYTVPQGITLNTIDRDPRVHSRFSYQIYMCITHFTVLHFGPTCSAQHIFCNCLQVQRWSVPDGFSSMSKNASRGYLWELQTVAVLPFHGIRVNFVRAHPMIKEHLANQTELAFHRQICKQSSTALSWDPGQLRSGSAHDQGASSDRQSCNSTDKSYKQNHVQQDLRVPKREHVSIGHTCSHSM